MSRPELRLIPLGQSPSGYFEPTWDEAPVLENHHISDRYWRLRLQSRTIAARTQPGQFLTLTIARAGEDSPVLPRPMAVFDADPASGVLEVVYGAVGKGTFQLTTFRANEQMLVVGPLGHGFHIPASTGSVLLLGRGIGTCSLTLLAARSSRIDRQVTAVASGRHRQAIVGEDFYRRIGAHVLPVHDTDGSSNVTRLRNLLMSRFDPDPPDLVAACGSRRLENLAAELGTRWNADTQISLEAHMACGLGYCHGCSTGTRSTTSESPLICRDGPVFRTMLESVPPPQENAG